MDSNYQAASFVGVAHATTRSENEIPTVPENTQRSSETVAWALPTK
ncbi:hypothetical protein ACMYUL_05170 [Neisseria sp. CP9]